MRHMATGQFLASALSTIKTRVAAAARPMSVFNITLHENNIQNNILRGLNSAVVLFHPLWQNGRDVNCLFRKQKKAAPQQAVTIKFISPLAATASRRFSCGYFPKGK
jgi:hypothetical protein